MAAPFFRISKSKKKKKLYSCNKRIQFKAVLKTIDLLNEKLCIKQADKFKLNKRKLFNLLLKK
jgi:ribosomal protein L32